MAPPAHIVRNPNVKADHRPAPAVQMVAAFQAIEALELLAGREEEINHHLVSMDAWSGGITNLKVQSAYNKGNCPCCKRGEYAYLDGRRCRTTMTLCGRDAVQVNVDGSARVAREPVRQSRFMLKVHVDDYELTLFADGRAIIKGADDPDKARTLYAKYFGA